MESDVNSSKRLYRREDIENITTSEFANYDVFISHRGPDTKTGFVSYLHRILEAAGLQTFLDISIDKGEGEDVWESVEAAIKNSRIAVVLFSEYFATSAWCLRELEVILDTPGIKVLPIFYNVRASEVRFPESGQLKDGFKKLSERYNKTIIERWRERLEEASKLMGWEHAGVHKRLEAELLSEIVGKILALANRPLPLDASGYVVGVKQVTKEIIQILEKKKEVLMLGLWGIGGIGKSTLARELYNQLSIRYDSACYIDDVTEKVYQGGVTKVQQHIMRVLCKDNSIDIEGKSEGKRGLEERLCKKRFLLVLDDVRDNDDLEYWISSKVLAEGSMCIVTSRDRTVFERSTSFKVEREVYIHDVQGLSIVESERVFMSHAFGGSSIMKPRFEELASSISKGCGGVPLLLKVYGNLLKNKDNVDVWKEVLAKLTHGTIMDEKKIFECLRVCYDDLSSEQQEMFLDIACALIGERKDLAVQVWKSLKGSPEKDIYSLIEKALILVDEEGCLKMHDHLRDMGREIVRQKRASEGIIRHLWMPESLTLVGKNEQLPDSIQTLVLSIYIDDIYKIEGQGHIDVSHMKDLRILMCDGPINILSSLPRNICWYRHSNQNDQQVDILFTPQNNKLILLEFRNSHIQRVPKTLRELSNLEVLDLSMCDCLFELPHSFGGLKKMRELKLNGSGILSLPESFGELSNLEVLDLSMCDCLFELPHSFGGLKKMQELKLNGSGILSLPESFGELSNLEVLDLSMCKNLGRLPHSFGGFKKMQELKLNGSGILGLPESFGELRNLKVLDLSMCKNLGRLPHSFGGFKKMQELKLNGSGILDLPESFGELCNLEVLDLSMCKNLGRLPHSFGGLKKMQELKLHGSGILGLPESFGKLMNLEVLDLSMCMNLFELPHSFGGLKKMRELELDGSGIKGLPESFGELSNLEVLGLSKCSNLFMLPDSFGSLEKMRVLKLDGSEIRRLPDSFAQLRNLDPLDLSGCSHHLTMLFSEGKFLSNLCSRDLPSIRLLGKGLASIGYLTKWVNQVSYARKDFVGVPSNIFREEADILVKLKGHQNVLKTYGLTIDKLSCSLVLECMDDKLSGSLQKKKDQRKRTAPAGTDSANQSDQNHALPFELQEALDLMVQIARGMEHIHDQGVIHGDLKTRNILVNYKTDEDKNLSVEVVKVADFGLVKTKRNSMSYASRQVFKLDMVRWKAPEILATLLSEAALSESDSDPDEECTGSGTVEMPADVYSFALICFQILTGEEPYPQRKWKDTVKDIVSGELRPKLPSDPPCPEILSELLISCWDSDPGKRPPISSIREKLEHIHSLQKEQSQPEPLEKDSTADCSSLKSMELVGPNSPIPEASDADHDSEMDYSAPDSAVLLIKEIC